MEAQYRSRCLLCNEDIEPGDEIVYDDDADGYVHDSCAYEQEDDR